MSLDIVGILHLRLKATIVTSILLQKPHKQMEFFHKNKFCQKLDPLQVSLST